MKQKERKRNPIISDEEIDRMRKQRLAHIQSMRCYKMESKQNNENIENKRERQEYTISQQSLTLANYHLTDNAEERCNVCDQGQIVLGTGIRLCKQHRAFVTCGATCDLQIRLKGVS